MPEPTHKSVVLLDAMGTLVALEPPGPLLAAELRSSHGIALDPGEAERAFAAEVAYYRAHHLEGRDEPSLANLRRRCAEALHAALPPRGARGLTVAEVEAAMRGALRFSAYPDALATLPVLRARGVKVVVVSNWDVSLPAVLQATGMGGFAGVLTSAHLGAAKPAPEIFRAALALAGVPAERALHVGDSPDHDVAGALAAGVGAVLLRREGADADEGIDADPIAPGAGEVQGVTTISSLAELPAMLT